MTGRLRQHEGIDLAGEVRARSPTRIVAEFVAQSVSRDQGATDRLAQAFQALVPDEASVTSCSAGRRAEQPADRPAAGFPDLWKSAEHC